MKQSFDRLLSKFRVGILEIVESRPSDEGWLFRVILMFFKQLFHFDFDEVDHVVLLEHVQLVHVDDDVADSDLLTEEDVLFGLGHGAIDSWNDENTGVHLGCSGDHIFDIIDVAGTINVCVMPCLCFVLNGGSIDGDTPGSLFGSLIDWTVFNVFGFLFVGKIFSNGWGEGGFSVIDMTDGADWVGTEVPLTWPLERSNLAKEWVSLWVRLRDLVR